MYNKIIIVTLVLVIAGLVIYALNPANKGTEIVSNNLYVQTSPIECFQTADKYLEKVTISELNIVEQIGSIDYASEVLPGANQKNLVPPITKPQFIDYDEVDNCFSNDRQVITVTVDNTTHVYPQAILDYHIVIHDKINSSNIIVVYSPISGSTKAFINKVKSEELTFGYTGSLYKNTDLIADFKTSTLWSAYTGKALVGMSSGGQLVPVELRIMSYGRAKTEYPDAEILSFATGFRRNYGIDPYLDFKNSNMFFQEPDYVSELVQDKSLVVGFEVDGKKYAVPAEAIIDENPYLIELSNTTVTIKYIDGEFLAYSDDNETKKISIDIMYWYVWYDYYPNTTVV